MPASASWEHITTRGSFVAAASKLGFTLLGGSWLHLSGAAIAESTITELLDKWEAGTIYPEILASMVEEVARRS